MSEELVGTITHYFPKPEVGVIKLAGELRVGDTVRFSGSTTDFEQRVSSLQIEHEQVESAEAGSEVAMKVSSRVRAGDEVYRVSAEG